MKNKLGIVSLIGVLVAIGFLFMSLPTVVAQGPPPPRPDPPPGRPGSPPDRPGPPQLPPQIPVGGGGGSTGYVQPEKDSKIFLPCSTVHGFVQNWGYRNEPDVMVDMGGASWQVQKFTDNNGYYASDCLGMGIGIINPVVPPGLHPLTEDVAVRLGSREGFEVNLGLYGNESPSGLPGLAMVASDAVAMPGQTLTYTIWVTNTLNETGMGQIMENVLVTDLFRENLIPVEATTTQGTTELWDNLISVELGQVLPGQTAVITIATMVQYDASPSIITNKASLIYKDHVTIQTSPVPVDIQGANVTELALPLLLPETGAEYPYP